MAFSYVCLGALLLYGGGEALVKSSVNLARIWGMSPLLVGLTVVAFGTSSPELAASLIAAMRDAPDIALGNVIGSNIANLGLILGATAILYPITAKAEFIRREIPIMLIVSALVPLVLVDRIGSRAEGIALLVLLAPYLWILLRGREAKRVELEFDREYGAEAGLLSAWRAVLIAVLGIVLLVAGASILIEGAVTLARSFGVSERVIGVTIVAVGTSLPELAAALVAARRREADIVIGNLIGSNIFNVLVVLGAALTVRPMNAISEAIWVDLVIMLAFSISVLPFLAVRQRIGRPEGMFLVSSYLVYVYFLYA
jgi:cation:H+ antiporter